MSECGSQESQNPHPVSQKTRDRVGHPCVGVRFSRLFATSSCAVSCTAQKVAITFDDLPLNGELPAGVTRVEIDAGHAGGVEEAACAGGVWVRQCAETGRESRCGGGVEVVGGVGAGGESYVYAYGFE